MAPNVHRLQSTPDLCCVSLVSGHSFHILSHVYFNTAKWELKLVSSADVTFWSHKFGRFNTISNYTVINAISIIFQFIERIGVPSWPLHLSGLCSMLWPPAVKLLNLWAATAERDSSRVFSCHFRSTAGGPLIVNQIFLLGDAELVMKKCHTLKTMFTAIWIRIGVLLWCLGKFHPQGN